eukprot:CAMPEP_0175073658 /NCGR_PEP_ID=MMETSP0052_2-20121109/20731_1 /TAXON_ID=51329 ORGANISM="Polytomella parva, Strain SAG 63-3" /NCGR_SAMPLE_ID=MMETSP0052_2 /ASSEMBLY_ACC=CAM_ASM_000194 /LENGTH=256 /DNA_ID=CAMNT_0016341585 /DNA_START=114 /DNA_END=884 /DNA_ORIENTATION=-
MQEKHRDRTLQLQRIYEELERRIDSRRRCRHRFLGIYKLIDLPSLSVGILVGALFGDNLLCTLRNAGYKIQLCLESFHKRNFLLSLPFSSSSSSSIPVEMEVASYDSLSTEPCSTSSSLPSLHPKALITDIHNLLSFCASRSTSLFDHSNLLAISHSAAGAVGVVVGAIGRMGETVRKQMAVVSTRVSKVLDLGEKEKKAEATEEEETKVRNDELKVEEEDCVKRMVEKRDVEERHIEESMNEVNEVMEEENEKAG